MCTVIPRSTADLLASSHSSHSQRPSSEPSKWGDSSHFAGQILDARIYDSALSDQQLASLKPNLAGVPMPWAWWSFADKTGVDRMGRFPVTQLSGGAKIENGRLILDGREATMLCRNFVPAMALLLSALNASIGGVQAQETNKYPDWRGAWSCKLILPFRLDGSLFSRSFCKYR